MLWLETKKGGIIMSGGINIDEEKRRLQFMQYQAEQKAANAQKLDFGDKKQVKDRRQLVVTIAVVAALVLGLILLSKGGVI
jgi:hypothetical protein